MDKPVYVYVLKAKGQSLRYVGITSDLERRMIEHNTHSDAVKRQLGDYDIILVEQYPTYLEARKREKWLKSGVGRAWLDKYELAWGSQKASKAAPTMGACPPKRCAAERRRIPPSALAFAEASASFTLSQGTCLRIQTHQYCEGECPT
jgi:putative endonuclease